jgi:hypothetical protein
MLPLAGKGQLLRLAAPPSDNATLRCRLGHTLQAQLGTTPGHLLLVAWPHHEATGSSSSSSSRLTVATGCAWPPALASQALATAWSCPGLFQRPLPHHHHQLQTLQRLCAGLQPPQPDTGVGLGEEGTLLVPLTASSVRPAARLLLRVSQPPCAAVSLGAVARRFKKRFLNSVFLTEAVCSQPDVNLLLGLPGTSAVGLRFDEEAAGTGSDTPALGIFRVTAETHVVAELAAAAGAAAMLSPHDLSLKEGCAGMEDTVAMLVDMIR